MAVTLCLPAHPSLSRSPAHRGCNQSRGTLRARSEQGSVLAARARAQPRTSEYPRQRGEGSRRPPPPGAQPRGGVPAPPAPSSMVAGGRLAVRSPRLGPTRPARTVPPPPLPPQSRGAAVQASPHRAPPSSGRARPDGGCRLPASGRAGRPRAGRRTAGRGGRDGRRLALGTGARPRPRGHGPRPASPASPHRLPLHRCAGALGAGVPFAVPFCRGGELRPAQSHRSRASVKAVSTVRASGRGSESVGLRSFRSHWHRSSMRTGTVTSFLPPPPKVL